MKLREPFKTTVWGIIALGVISSLIASMIWNIASPPNPSLNKNKEPTSQLSAIAPDRLVTNSNADTTPGDPLTIAKQYFAAKQYGQALPLFYKAAESGNIVAEYYLGKIYLEGTDDIRNEVKAVDWFRRAADAGSGNGMNGFGVMYANGMGGLPYDDKQAVEWFRKAADANSPRGMANLGVMYDCWQWWPIA
jgi:TPR repeat protein